MKISERIESAQTALLAKKDLLAAKLKSLDETPTDDTLIAEVDSLSAEIEAETKSIEALKKAEIALASNVSAPAIVKHQPMPENPADILVKNAVCTFEAYLKRVPLELVMNERYGQDRMLEQMKAVNGYVSKAAQNPAMTNVAGWAQELTRETYGAFMDLLAAESVVPRLPLSRYAFDGFAGIAIATRANKTKNLAAAFRAEGAPIRVGATSTGAVKLTPKSMGVIGTFTNELFARSTPNIEQAIRKWMIEDTAEALDAAFLDATAASATRPAGIQVGAGTAASSGVTQAAITADLKARFAAMAAANLGRNIVFVMNTARLLGLKLLLTPQGTLAFPEAASNQLLGYPVITSTAVPAGVVYIIDASELAFAGGSPSFMGTDVATIHEEDAAPLPIVDGAGTAAQPVRSLYQTNSSALRALWEVDWAVLRTGAVQTLTAVAW